MPLGIVYYSRRRIERTRQLEPFESLNDFAARTNLEDAVLRRLAEAGAFARFDKNRRNAIWQARGFRRIEAPQLPLVSTRSKARFRPLNFFETIDWDYHSTGHSPRAHPLAPLREALSAQGLPDAAAVKRMPDGRQIRYTGLVICRQRPSTAGGVVFMTLEDETGFVNVVIWEKVFKRFMVLAKTASLIGVTGKLQVASGVTHLIAESLWTPRLDGHPGHKKSRDFH
jgi:error-prone DNA polymerase